MLPVIFAPAAEALITALVTVAVKKLVDDGNPYPTKPSEPRSAKSQELVLGFAPKTDDMMALWSLLKARFPDARLEVLLAADDGLSEA